MIGGLGRAALTSALLLAAGCNSATGTAGAVDAGAADASCPFSPPPAGWTYPPGPYGADVGKTFEDFSLEDCEGRPTTFGSVLAGAELVLFNVGAGWCQPCIEETKTLEREIASPYCARGLRVVQVLFQDEESRPATKLFCRRWRDRFGLGFPVLADPLFMTRRYFEAAQTPLNLLVDRNGVIRFRVTGTVPSDLGARIDMLLPP